MCSEQRTSLLKDNLSEFKISGMFLLAYLSKKNLNLYLIRVGYIAHVINLVSLITRVMLYQTLQVETTLIPFLASTLQLLSRSRPKQHLYLHFPI